MAVGLDHIWPRTRGGKDGWPNRAPACQSCDNAKGASSLLIFLVAGTLASSRTARRQYASAARKAIAFDTIRHLTATKFYSGNIRGMEKTGAST